MNIGCILSREEAFTLLFESIEKEKDEWHLKLQDGVFFEGINRTLVINTKDVFDVEEHVLNHLKTQNMSISHVETFPINFDNGVFGIKLFETEPESCCKRKDIPMTRMVNFVEMLNELYLEECISNTKITLLSN